MTVRKKILIADPDPDAQRGLTRALSDGYEVLVVGDGSQALETSILQLPDLIIIHEGCPLIGATHFLRILRTNPRTENIPLIVLSDGPVDHEGFPSSYLLGVLLKPLNPDEARAHVDGLLRTANAARRVEHDNGAVSGQLDQISMVDLLQIFSINRKSGCLKVSHNMEDRRAEVFLHQGRIEHAILGLTKGEKALFRLLTWRGGHFSFVPGERAPTVSLSGSTDSLLMEGMRQGDELGRLQDQLPTRVAVLERTVPPEGLPEGLHPVTGEIFGLVEHYPRVADLLDRAVATDMEVYVALTALLHAELLRVVERTPARPQKAILSTDALFELRSRLRRAGLVPMFLEAPKVAVMAAEPEDMRRFRVGLGRLNEFSAGAASPAGQLPVGTLGHLRLGDGMEVHFYAVPSDHRQLPLCFGLSAGTVAGIILGTGSLDRIGLAMEMVRDERHAPLLMVRRVGEPTPATTHRCTVLDVEDFFGEGGRQILATLFGEVVGGDLRGVYG